MADTMKAWQLAFPGRLDEKLELNHNGPRPTSRDLRGQDILVLVRGAALNPADYKVAELGLLARAVLSFPQTPCMDLSGTVLPVGPDVGDVLVGDRVTGRLDPFKPTGALSEQVVLERDDYAKIPPPPPPRTSTTRWAWAPPR
ncbi:reticulon-4-interacting protein 1 [Cordyceps fumosorosea ARSEF 2679]|uniref:Reticulon-4-interacting protein 1 n=1 Tax=Cordyceps fumosorosea (strain ARSEF 2679) TaxID=1081104 RepID=A0A168BBW8_CORFA|nr:reticulon-4-interacting protein 1 [Cordyceps fumosorosea ARSEF 2679]OAA69907.1 reticulon-4-interacting protein 1 [Cordyceps fumosorosea ARSEF 2679]